MTVTTTLTDRYVWATLRTLPDAKRADIERELRASIEDAMEARLESGADPDEAERAVLLELGDPIRLAAQYAERPLYVIGPSMYPDWIRLLKLLLATVLPIAGLAVGTVQALIGSTIGEIIAEVVLVLLGTTMHLIFWTTLVFWIVERAGSTWQGSGWTLAQLPDLDDGKHVKLSEVIGALGFAALVAVLMIWQQNFSFFTVDGRPLPLLREENWSFWWPYVIVVLALDALVLVAVYGRRRWTYGLVATKAVTNLAFAIPAIWLLLADRVFTSAFLERLDWGTADPHTVLTVIGVLTIGISAVWDVVQNLIRARRARL
ncbi:hypothetical protein CLV46_0048 [Diaminobutyricimonas aerilata]|uniref:Uncharacterized protein n=1 Tax=Diaminobutyricimonas aerilata TaxID=1162967 RepID=A0A2M9CEZ5_9MICO|nr:permease prefix domain 1-containing protein [Diaminobutyricimonas aerilata]PJJ70526.1 hypothetical protein CLV46_0048 [Diaminobutyricimonas aerilata]